MSIMLRNNYSRFRINLVKRLLSTKLNVNIGDKMKILNDNKQYEKVLELFNQFNEKNISQCSNWIIIQSLKACTELRDKNCGLKIHQLISNRLEKDPYVLPSLVNFYMKSGDVNRAESLFNTSTKKTSSMYGSMMKGYILNNLPNKAISLFKTIKDPSEVIINLLFNACAKLGTNKELNLVKRVASNIPQKFYSNPYVLTSLIDGYMKCEDVKSAESIFRAARNKDLGIYAAMMTGYNTNDLSEKTIELFDEIAVNHIYGIKNTKNDLDLSSNMKNKDFERKVIIFFCLIKALAQVGMLERAKTVVQRIPTIYLCDHRIKSALVDLWGKVGGVNEAKEVFENIYEPNSIDYTAMINSYGLNGMGIEAIELFRQMPKELINEVTHICVLNACAHSGLVDEARVIFSKIEMKTEMIYTTMIDCLSRVAAFEEAQKLIEEFECEHSPSVVMYNALLSGARNEKNSKVAQDIVDRMQKLFPEMKNSFASASILLANVYTASGDIDKATDIKIQMHRSGVKKKMGLSFTELDGKILKFRAHDRSHPFTDELYAEVDRISKELIEHGHEFDASWITRPIDPDETIETVLCGHSERLAIAAHFMFNRKPRHIQIKKNLRVCGDCHRATKLIALIRQCEIVVRDANRIHHFHTNGKCSCQDHF